MNGLAYGRLSAMRVVSLSDLGGLSLLVLTWETGNVEWKTKLIKQRIVVIAKKAMIIGMIVSLEPLV